MYRLLKCKSTNFQNLTRVGTAIAKDSLRQDTDLVCQKYYNFTNALSRRYCINTIPEVKPRKVRKRRSKKYADILIVTSNSASEGRVTVKNINSKNLVLLKASSYLNKLFDEKPTDTTHSAINDNVTNYLRVSSVESGETASVEADEIIEDAFEKSPGVFDPATDEMPDNVEPKKQENMPKPYKKEVDFRIMRAQFEIRTFLEKSHQNFYKMQDHRSQTKKDNLRNVFYKNVDLYNELLRGLAGSGHYKQVEDVIKCAQEDEVELNAQSFASIFECLGRRLFKENFVKEIRHFTKELHKQDLTFDDMMNKAIFFKDDREMVLKAINAIEPEYSITFEQPDLQYSNDLVNHLNCEDQLDSSQYLKKKGNNEQGLFTGPMLQRMIHDQLDVERDGYVTIKNIQSEPAIANDNVERHNEARKEILRSWEKQATDGFSAKYEFISSQHRYLRLKPYLSLLPVKDYVQIILNAADTIASGSDLYCPSFQQLHRELGYRVYNKYCVLFKEKQCILDKIIKVHEEYCNQYADRHPKLGILPTDVDNLNERQRWQMLEYLQKANGATPLKYQQEWPPNMVVKVGEYLYNVMVQYLRINVNIMEPDKKKYYHDAFYITSRQVLYRMKRNAYKPHTKLKQIYNMSISENLRFPTNLVPMKCPPVPWSSFATGGYLVAPCDLVRLHYQADMQKQKIIKAEPKTLYPILDSLNQLSAVPWKINNNILNLILQVFKSGGSIKLNVPVPPSAFLKQDKNLFEYNKEKLEMYSLWCDCLYRLSVANHFRNDVFWLPHNLDFRGRVYPIPPHLNHLGADLARSMLIFAEERPLGPKGLDWLKIHLINLTGLKKRSSIPDRLAYANEIMDDILDSADKPLDGKQWWAESEDPWQTLACCMEIAAAHRSPNPEEFRSGFPIHQDGSCNGLQHYAALGRDSAGAYSVNLKPDALPQDVYTTVVDLVEEARVKDAKAGNELAKSLEGFVKRKIIKQTIMTTVYGVTEYGARLQIQKQLKALDNFPRENVVRASNYLSKLTFRSLTSMFTSSKAIQDWFTNCARYIVSVKRKQVEWVTPLGLPVVQPYSNKNGITNWNISMDSFQLPDARKQKNAFAPNFIHSLDSSHMMLTSLHMERAGIVFVSVHDCFWTHPATVAIMNQICREQFVALHSKNILEDLSMFFFEQHSFDENEITKDGSESDIKKYKLNVLLKNLPKTGNFDLDEVLNSTYFFS